MAVFTKELKVSNAAPQQTIVESEINRLNPDEIVLLLEILKKSTFLGENVEAVYNLVLKLQNQYLQQVKQ